MKFRTFVGLMIRLVFQWITIERLPNFHVNFNDLRCSYKSNLYQNQLNERSIILLYFNEMMPLFIKLTLMPMLSAQDYVIIISIMTENRSLKYVIQK